MNIVDVKKSDIPTFHKEEHFISSIFIRQEYLHERYKPIEEASGIGLSLIEHVPFSIDDRRCQYILKDFAWRVTEELAEAAEALAHGNEVHYIEELIDALHFFTEMLIIAKFRDTDIIRELKTRGLLPDDPAYTDSLLLDIIVRIGISMNCLKQKPWKQSHFQTDETLFTAHLLSAYCALIKFLQTMMSNDEIRQVYYQKSLVNSFRMRSNY